jgi:hypothetical protein
MEQGHCRCASKSRGCGSEAGSGYKTQHVMQIIKGKWANEPVPDQPGHYGSFASVTEALEQRGQKISVAHEVGSNCAYDHANHNRWTVAPI